jgi:ribosome assembly protein SQT1
VQVFAGHDGEVTCGLFTNDGKTIVSGGEDGSVRLWAPKTGQCKHVFTSANGVMEGHSNIVTAIAGSADGDYAVSGGMDGEVRLYLVPKKKLLQKFTHSIPMKSEEKADLPPPPPSVSEQGADYDPSDDVEREDEMSVLGVECVGISSNTWKYVASGGMDKTMKIWDITSGTCRCVCQHEDSVVALKWHATLPVVVTACLDRIIRIWDARSGACVQEFTGHRDIVTNLDFRQQPVVTDSNGVKSTATGDVVVSVSDDGTAKVFVVDVQALVV